MDTTYLNGTTLTTMWTNSTAPWNTSASYSNGPYLYTSIQPTAIPSKPKRDPLMGTMADEPLAWLRGRVDEMVALGRLA